MINNFVLKKMKQISIIIALALLTTIANAQNIKGSHEVRANDEVKKQTGGVCRCRQYRAEHGLGLE